MDNSENPYAAPTTFDTPHLKPTEGEVYRDNLATLWQRFAGSLIDSLILIAAIIPLSMAFFFLAALVVPGYFLFSDEPEGPLIWILDTFLGILAAAISFLAINGYLLHTRGQTVGKLVMKTRIVSDQGQLVPLPRLFLLRYVLIWCLAMIPLIGNFLNLVDALLIFRSNRKCLHDEFAGTKVVTTLHVARQRKLPDKIEVPDF